MNRSTNDELGASGKRTMERMTDPAFPHKNYSNHPILKTVIFQSEEDKGTSMEVPFPHVRPSGEMLIPADNDKSHTHIGSNRLH